MDHRLVHPPGRDETRTRKTMLAGAFLTGLLIIPAARAETPLGALAFLTGGSLVGLSLGNLFAIIQCCAPPNELGLWTGFENFAGNIGGILAPLATGFLIARTGHYLAGFALAAGILVAGIFAYGFIVGELEPEHNNCEGCGNHRIVAHFSHLRAAKQWILVISGPFDVLDTAISGILNNLSWKPQYFNQVIYCK